MLVSSIASRRKIRSEAIATRSIPKVASRSRPKKIAEPRSRDGRLSEASETRNAATRNSP